MSDALSTWSRRRAAVAAEARADALAAEQAVLEREHAELCEKTDEEILEALGLPDPDSLVQGDDFKAFLSKTVPAHLRKRALRTLWRSNPVLACVDGLNDYDDDYLTGSFGQDPIKTTYQVGKGMLSHLLEMDRQKNAKVDLPDQVPSDEETAEFDQAVIEEVSMPKPQEEINDPEGQSSLSPRRMRFKFKGDVA